MIYKAFIVIATVLITASLASIEMRVKYMECKVTGGELVRIEHKYLDLRECKRPQ